MFGDYKVVVVTPAGRRDYLEILAKYVARERGLVDRWDLWENTTVDSDLAYLRSLREEMGGFVRVVKRPGDAIHDMGYKNTYIHKFFASACDDKTIYIRLDDDVLWIQDGGLEKLVRFRVENPDYFLVFANTVNNCICSHIHQRMGLLGHDMGEVEYHCLGELGWVRGDFAERVHRLLLDRVGSGGLEAYDFGRWELHWHDQVSINCICWFGCDMGMLGGEVGIHEESWLCEDGPRALNKVNCIYGGTLVSHYAFMYQREYLNTTDLLDRYRLLAGLPWGELRKDVLKFSSDDVVVPPWGGSCDFDYDIDVKPGLPDHVISELRSIRDRLDVLLRGYDV